MGDNKLFEPTHPSQQDQVIQDVKEEIYRRMDNCIREMQKDCCDDPNCRWRNYPSAKLPEFKRFPSNCGQTMRFKRNETSDKERAGQARQTPFARARALGRKILVRLQNTWVSALARKASSWLIGYRG
jgi:hypothetical protein